MKKICKIGIIAVLAAAMVMAFTAFAGANVSAAVLPENANILLDGDQEKTTAADEAKEETTAAEEAAEEEAAEEEDGLVGIYTAMYDMKEMMNKELEEVGMEFKTPIETLFILELKDDETFILDLDAAGFAESLSNAFQEEGEDLIKAALTAEGITEDQFDLLAQQGGYDSFTEFADEMISEIQTQISDSLVEEIGDTSHAEGVYKVKDDKLMLSAVDAGTFFSDEGTINDDGSISVSSATGDGGYIDLLFEKQGTEDKDSKKLALKPGVLVDNDIVKIELKGFGSDYSGPTIKFTVDNKTDKKISVSASELSINNYMIDPVFYIDIAAGKQANTDMSFLTDTVTKIGVEDFEKDATSLECKFRVTDTDDWSTLSEEKVSLGETPDTEDDLGDENVLVDNENIFIQFIDFSDSFIGPEMQFFVKNRTDKDIYLRINDFSVNGKMLDLLMASDFGPAKKGYETASFFSSDIEDAGFEDLIAEAEDMEWTFEIMDAETYKTIDEITITFEP